MEYNIIAELAESTVCAEYVREERDRYGSYQTEAELEADFIRILTESIVNMEAVGNLMVIKTLSASAAAACEAIDSMKWNEVLGTIAGDNTVLIIGRSPEAIEIVQNRFHNLLKR